MARKKSQRENIKPSNDDNNETGYEQYITKDGSLAVDETVAVQMLRDESLLESNSKNLGYAAFLAESLPGQDFPYNFVMFFSAISETGCGRNILRPAQ